MTFIPLKTKAQPKAADFVVLLSYFQNKKCLFIPFFPSTVTVSSHKRTTTPQ